MEYQNKALASMLKDSRITNITNENKVKMLTNVVQQLLGWTQEVSYFTYGRNGIILTQYISFFHCLFPNFKYVKNHFTTN